MQENIMKKLKDKKAMMKLSIAALASAAAMYGGAALHSASAMSGGVGNSDAGSQCEVKDDLSASIDRELQKLGAQKARLAAAHAAADLSYQKDCDEFKKKLDTFCINYSANLTDEQREQYNRLVGVVVPDECSAVAVERVHSEADRDAKDINGLQRKV